MKKRSEEIQKMKVIYGGKPDLKYRQISTPASLKHDIKHSRNHNNNKNNNLNQLNIFSYKDFKKGNIEDLYYNQIRKDEIKQIIMENKMNLHSSSQDNIFSNTIDKRILPIIFSDNQKKLTSSLND